MVGDPQHFVQRPQVYNQADRQEGARLRVLRAARARQQAHPGAVHGQPRALHAPPQARHHRRAADEGAGARGEARQAGAEVRHPRHIIHSLLNVCCLQWRPLT